MGGGGAFYAAKAIFAHASSVEYIAFVSLLVVGILAGVGVVLLLDVGIFLIGALLGVCLALLINTAVLYRIAPVRMFSPPLDPPPRPLTPLLPGFGRMRAAAPPQPRALRGDGRSGHRVRPPGREGATVRGLPSPPRSPLPASHGLLARRITVILATAFAGAYAAAYGAGHFAGKFPNPFSVQDALHEGSVPDAWWAYFAGVLVFACAGTIVQLCTTREPGEEEHDVAPHREADHREARADPERGSQRYERLYEENAPRRGTGRPLQYMGRRHGDTRSWGASGRRDGRPAAVM